MMTQADVFSESMNREEEKATTSTASASGEPQKDPVVLSPKHIQTEYKYDQGTDSLTAPNLNESRPQASRTETTPIQPSKYFAKDR